MGEESKKSLDQFSNNETILLWERLFSSLMEGVPSYRKLQKEIEDVYFHFSLSAYHTKIQTERSL